MTSLSFPAIIDFQSVSSKTRERDRERSFVFLWLLRGCSCPWGPSSCPSLSAWRRTERPVRVGFGGDSGSSGVCRISAAGSSCHLCGGLPGGGTAETDASQGKSREQESGMQSGGHRAWMEPCPGCVPQLRARLFRAPVAAVRQENLTIPDGEGQKTGYRRCRGSGGTGGDFPAQSRLGGVRLKPGELPHPSCHPGGHIPHGIRVRVLPNSSSSLWN